MLATFQLRTVGREIQIFLGQRVWITLAEKYKFQNLDKPLCMWRRSKGQVSSVHHKEQMQFADAAYQSNKEIINALAKEINDFTISPVIEKELDWVSRKAFANLYYDYAYALLFHKKPAIARKEIIISLRYNPFKWRSYLLWLGTFIPLGLVKQIRKIKRLLSGGTN